MITKTVMLDDVWPGDLVFQTDHGWTRVHNVKHSDDGFVTFTFLTPHSGTAYTRRYIRQGLLVKTV